MSLDLESTLTVNSVTMYLKEIDKIPLLTREEEQTLTHDFGECCQPKIQENPNTKICAKCQKIKQTLITSNLRFVVSVAKKYQGNSLSLSDLINEGNLGLIVSIDKFNYKLGYHFISYAVWWIKQSIMKAISEKSRMIRLPMNRTNELFKITNFIDIHSKKHGTTPTNKQISKEIGISTQEIQRIIHTSNGHTSLEYLLTENNESINQNYDIDHCAVNPEQTLIKDSLSINLNNLLESLSERERLILIKRYGLDGTEKMTLSQIGKLIGLTKERVRQLEKQSLSYLKKIAKEKQLTLYFNT
ncbi:MAG: sigma-70 family RNA polymerase sigma factor [Brevinema sp.]